MTTVKDVIKALKKMPPNLEVSKFEVGGKWSKERCVAEALKYKTKKEWRLFNATSYQMATILNCIKECSLHMQKSRKYTKEQCIDVAKKYVRRVEWRNSIDYEFYVFARQRNWTTECCNHMDNKRK